jgi:hypothetical protein
LEDSTVKALGGSKATRKFLALASMGTAMFVALILLSPLTILLPLTNPAPVATTAFMTSERTTTATYTSTAFDTSFVSTTGNMAVQVPVSIPSQIVGFMAPKGKCSEFTMPLAVNSGTNLNLQLTSTNPANLYLLPTNTFQISPNGCSLIGGSLMAENNFTAYTLQWTAAEDGTVYLLLTGPNTIITLRNNGTTNSVEQLATITYASTEANLNLYSSINIANYTTTATTTSVSQRYLPPSLRFGLAIVTFLVALLAPVLLLASKNRFLRLKTIGSVISRA